MNPQDDKKSSRRKSSGPRKKGTNPISIVIILLLAIGSGFFVAPFLKDYLPNRERKIDQAQQVPVITEQETITTADKEPVDTAIESLDTTPNGVSATTETVVEEAAPDSIEQNKPAKDPKVIQRSTEKTIKTIASFYNHLDHQPYIKEAQLKGTSNTYFTSLIQKLLNNPPVVTRETDDLFTILQNTAHFFRIIGKENIFLLKGILHNEKDNFEEILADYYYLSQQPQQSIKDLGLTIPANALYDYAGFFLNTMGGRLYLFRRDSQSRMVISYYALLIIDQANQNGINRHGIPIDQSIESLIAEIESIGSQLKLREQYLDSLYDLKEKYQ